MNEYLFKNANVITMDPARPKAEMILVRGDRIAAVGAAGTMQELQDGNSRVIDCAGRTVLPGFIDAHCHLRGFAESLVFLDLSPQAGGDSIAGIRSKIRHFCSNLEPGAWLRGKAYNEFYIKEKRHPNRWDLDDASSEHPVKLTHRSGHAHVLNSLALAEAGIDSATGDPPGGIIDRDLKTGEPTGILYGMNSFLSRRIPPVEAAELDRGIELAEAKMLSFGITSVQDASYHNSLPQWKQFESWKKRGILRERVTMMMGVEAFLAIDALSFTSTLDEQDLRLGGIKLMVDRVEGRIRPSGTELKDLVGSIHGAGLQVAIHALEEPVIEAAVEAIESCRDPQHLKSARHRIEHCSICRPDLMRRLTELGGTVVTQPSFLFQEGDRYLETVDPEDHQYLYSIGLMMECGLCVAAGSDAPIGNLNPMTGVCAAVTRTTGSGARIPGKTISRMQALRMYTSDAAAVNFEEHLKGSISPGKLADFIILDEDPLLVPAFRIKDVRVLMTVIGGEIVWSSPDAPALCQGL